MIKRLALLPLVGIITGCGFGAEPFVFHEFSPPEVSIVPFDERPDDKQVDWSDGLDLEEALTLANRHNLQLQASRFEIDLANAQRVTAGTYPYNPELILQGQRATPFSRPGDSVLKIGLSQAMEISGQRGYRVSIADENIRRSQFWVNNAERLLVSEVTALFYSVLLEQRRREIAGTNADLANRLLDAADARFKAKQVPEIEVNLVRLDNQRAQGELKRASQGLAQARARLAALLGDPSRTEFEARGEIGITGAAMDKGKIIHFALNKRPDLIALQSLAKLAEDRVGLARAKAWPVPSLGLFGERDTSRFPLDGTEGVDRDNILGVELSIPLPLMNTNRGEILESEVDQRRLAVEIAAMSQQIHRDIKLAVNRLELAKAMVELYEKELTRLSKQNLEDIEKAYTAGEVGTLEVIRAQEDFSRTNLGFLEAQFELRAALTELETAAGAKLSEIR